MTNEPLKSDRTRVRRNHKRGHYDEETVFRVLDGGMIAHISWVEDGKPVCIPTLYWREGRYVYWHGSTASRMMRSAAGLEVCFSCATLDGLVFASSAFHHSANYRSVVLFGTAIEISEDEEKISSLKAFMEGICSGRWGALRPVSTQELKGTKILKMKIEEGAAKIRTGNCVDSPEDVSWPIWTGVVPVDRVFGATVPDPNKPDTDIPHHIQRLVGCAFEEVLPAPKS